MAWDKGTDRASTVVVSWNVRGLNHLAKRSRVFSQLNKLRAEVVYLQETNLVNKDQAKLRRGGFTQMFYSDFSHKSRGVAILLDQNVLFEESNVIKDKNGHYIIVQEKLFNKLVVLANIYAPNWDNVDFFKHFFSLLPDLDSYDLILGGDSNCVLDPKQHRSSLSLTSRSKSARCINTFLQAYGVIDPWRYKYPTSKQFSFFSPEH